MVQILRKDVPEEQVWNLKDIFNSDEVWEKAYITIWNQVEELIDEPVSLDSSEKLLNRLNQLDELSVNLNQISSYAMFKYSEDESDSSNQQRNGKAHSLVEKASVVK